MRPKALLRSAFFGAAGTAVIAAMPSMSAHASLAGQVEGLKRVRAATYAAMAFCEHSNKRMGIEESYQALQAMLTQNGLAYQEKWLETSKGQTAILTVMSYMDSACSLIGGDAEMGRALMPLIQ